MKENLILVIAPLLSLFSLFFIVRKETVGKVRYLAVISFLSSVIIMIIDVNSHRETGRSLIHRIACINDTTSKGCVYDDDKFQTEFPETRPELLVPPNGAGAQVEDDMLDSQEQQVIEKASPVPQESKTLNDPIFAGASQSHTTDDFPNRNFVLANADQIGRLAGSWCVRGEGNVAEYYRSGQGLAKRESYLDNDSLSAVYISQGIQNTILYLPGFREYIIFRPSVEAATLNNEGLWLNGGAGYGIYKCS